MVVNIKVILNIQSGNIILNIFIEHYRKNILPFEYINISFIMSNENKNFR